MNLFEQLKLKLAKEKKTLIFPEGADARIVEACVRLKEEGLIEPIVLGTKEEIEAAAKKAGVSAEKLTTLDPKNDADMDEMVKAFVERRKGKVTEEDARTMLTTRNEYYGTLAIYMGKADGLVSGAAHSTADTVRPALQIIKVKEGYTKVSGIVIMSRGDETYFFADCAINMEPTAEDLAEIALQSCETAKQYGFDPSVAMLSFSTKGSAKSDDTEKVIHATEMAANRNPNMKIDGELQFDAAFVPEVAALKAPGSSVAGHANVFVFPSLEAGNIGYKIGQRFGGFDAVGPILQGLNAPVNDLSRGCNVDDVYKLAIITAAQAVK